MIDLFFQDRVVKQIDTTTASTTTANSWDTKLKEKLAQDNKKDKKADSKSDKPAPSKRDTTRFKNLLVSLKKDPKAPGNAITV